MATGFSTVAADRGWGSDRTGRALTVNVRDGDDRSWYADRVRLASLSLLALALLGCGGDAARGAGGGSGTGGGGGQAPDTCPAGELEVDGTCWPAGLPPDWTAPAPVTPDAGVAACGEGFVDDGAAGCEPVLPATPCTGLTMATVGDTACAPVVDCGTTIWGNIPVDASTIHVDVSYTGVSDGTASAPYTTIQAAVDAAPIGATIAVAAGIYAEDVMVSSTPVTLWGRCPDLVQVVGTSSAIWVDQAPGTVIRGVAATAPNAGIAMVLSPGSRVEEVASAGAGAVGVAVVGDGDEVVVRRALVVDAGLAGMISQGTMAVERSEVRRVAGPPTVGIAVYPDGFPAALRLEASYLHDVGGAGMLAHSADLLMTGSVVSDVAPNDDGLARGVELATVEPTTPATATIRQSVIRRTQGAGVAILSAIATIEDTTIDQVLPDARGLGSTVLAVMELDARLPSEVTLARSTLRNGTGYGVQVGNSVASLDRVLIDGVEEGVALGRGLGAFDGSDVSITDSEIVPDASVGVVAIGGTVAIDGSLIRRVRYGGMAGVGVVAQLDPDGLYDTAVTMVDSQVEDVVGDGTVAVGAALTLDGVTINDVRAVNLDDRDSGIAAGAMEGGTLTVRRADLRDVVTGVGAVDATLTVEGTRVTTSPPGVIGYPYADGRGLEIQRSTVTIGWSEIGPVFDAGIAAFDSTVETEGLAVHDVAVHAAEADHGVGIGVFVEKGSASATLRGNRIEAVDGIGLLTNGSSVVLDRSLVRDVRSGIDGSLGRGVQLQDGSVFELTDSQIASTREFALTVLRSSGNLRRTGILGVAPATEEGLFGDGVAIIASGPVQIEAVTIRDTTRAALSIFGSAVTLSDSDLRCNELPLVVEPLAGTSPQLTNGGGNLCGCDGEAVVCKALSVGLEPPEAVDTGAPRRP